LNLGDQQRPVVSVPKQVLRGIIDYAGLFPPAGLGMAETVRNYAAYSKSPEAWVLSRLVVPALRLEEFAHAAGELDADAIDVWSLSVLLIPNSESDIAKAASFPDSCLRKTGVRVAIDCVETKASVAEEIRVIAKTLPPEWTSYFEIPIGADIVELIDAIREVGACAKIRTGGLTGDAFPSVQQIANFVRTCAAQNVRFKATAGLHHAIRSVHPFTYEKQSPSGCMHGFLNLLLATALARAGLNESAIVGLLGEERADAFVFEETDVRWNSHSISYGDLVRARETLFVSFGSCSFTEPITELRAMRLL
jgi:hypothetical protein